ncbi:MAG: hypothetical protein ACOYX1_10535 [Acidobacteriota bacterium]
MTTRQTALAVLALAAFALLGWFVFPGRTWLQSDTQIYVPILERQYDPALFARDEIALRPHVKFTFYDEITVALRRCTGAEFHAVLAGQQLLFRAVGVTGAFLVGLAFGLPVPGALAAAGLFGLGAVINGPAVLTLEYEPVPRGFAVLWLLLALGLAMHRRWMWAGIAAVIATLYHPTTAAPFWVCLLLHWRYVHDRREGIALELSVALAAAGLAVIAILQPFGADRQVMLGRIPPALEQIQKYRGAYNWISLWPGGWLWQYPLLAALALAAWRRVRSSMAPEARFLSAALIGYGLAMMPLQWLLLDVGKWVLMPQFQPARAVLWVAVMAELLALTAAWKAAAERRWAEAGAWFAAAFLLPAAGAAPLLELWKYPERIAAAVLAAGLAFAGARWPRVAVVGAMAVFAVMPRVGRLELYPKLHSPELDGLAAWASTATGKDDVFLFADAGRSLEPGVFRARALRALYVDWKSGGQANLLRDYGYEWKRRWDAVREARPPLLALEEYAKLGVDWVVVRPANAPPGMAPAFQNARYAVFRTAAAPRGTVPLLPAAESTPARRGG